MLQSLKSCTTPEPLKNSQIHGILSICKTHGALLKVQFLEC